jgi:hypothetical protein
MSTNLQDYVEVRFSASDIFRSTVTDFPLSYSTLSSTSKSTSSASMLVMVSHLGSAGYAFSRLSYRLV